MTEETFKGDTKLPLKSPLARGERRFIDWLTPKIPRWIEGYHLTLATIPLSALCIGAGYLARSDRTWLWLATAALALQWFTDSFDGALGRYRDTGIPRWGYHMDHLLDYVFMCAILSGYAWFFDGTARILCLLLIPVFGTFFVNSYLAFGATGNFKITYIGFGPTEMRLLLIVVNTLIIILGKKPIAALLPYALPLLAGLICIVVYRSQKFIWKADLKERAKRI